MSKDKGTSNGSGLRKLTPEELAAYTVESPYKTREERREAMRRATTGLRVKVQVTRSMYRSR